MTARSNDRRADETFAVHALPRALRIGTGLLLGASGLGLPILLLRVVLASDPPMTPPTVLRDFLALSVLPALAALLVQRALRGEATLVGPDLVVRVGGQRFELALASIAAVEPWRLPLPEAGFRLCPVSGARFPVEIGAGDAAPLLAALAARGVSGADAARLHPTIVWARLRELRGRLGMRRAILKYPLFGAMVAGVLFNAQQNVAWGGLFGQYEVEGAWPWARTFLVYWGTATLYLVLYASVWRWPAEIVAWLAAYRGEAVAARVRVAAEWLCRVAYFVGIGLILALRFAE